VPEGGVRERLERVVERRQLADDGRVALARVEPAVQPPQLVAQLVEALEQRVELAISELFSLHRAKIVVTRPACSLPARPMALYLTLARVGFRRYAAYPAATAAGLFTNVFFGFLLAYVLLAVYDLRADVGGYDKADTVTFVWLAQGLLSVVASFAPSWWELSLRVRSGNVATDLQRPLDLQRMLLAQDFGRAAYQLLYRAAPPFLVGALVFDVVAPDSVVRWLAFGLSICLAVVVSFGIRFLANLMSFWLLDYRGPTTLVMVVSLLLSGLVVPLVFFPEPLGDLARLLPFASILQLPIDVFVGAASGGEIVGVLALQAFWALALLALGRAVLAAGTKKLVVQGG
jgi:ABC-2 type transport system permease protein